MAHNYSHWKNEHATKPERTRLHLAKGNIKTICGYNIIKRNMSKVSDGIAKSQLIKMCSNCMSNLKRIDPETLKNYPHAHLKKQSIKIKKTQQSETDKIVHPKLKKFKKIIKSAKEKKEALSAAIETALEIEEIDVPALEKIYKSLPDLEQWIGQAQYEADLKWKEDQNKFNDTKHFHIISCLRNFSLALSSLKNI